MAIYPETQQTYGVGEQDFKSLRQDECVYVDKTRYIEKILSNRMKYLFLARPRRFGKSLFLSTLRYFFEGRRELFAGLHIDSSAWTWEEYPVLYLDLNPERYHEAADLSRRLEECLEAWERKYDLHPGAYTRSQRFRRIIEAAHARTGRQAVILVDEYDKPLVSNLHDTERFEVLREELASLYSNFKSSAEHIKLVFLTGVSRFGRLSVFSDINNLKDISFTDDFADICGITEEELVRCFEPGIRRLAAKEGMTCDEARAALKLNYDGYRFTRTGSEIYNPWSVLNAMQDSAISDYWARTGKPTIIVQTLHRSKVDLEKILNTACTADQLEGMDLSNLAPLPLLYQTGYLTIKSYDRETQLYRLGVPNREVSRDLFQALLPYYVSDAPTLQIHAAYTSSEPTSTAAPAASTRRSSRR